MKNVANLLALAVLAAVASNASANTLELNTGTYSNGSSGGAYYVSHFGTALSTSDYSKLVSTSTSFETFCLEPNEDFNPGSTYSYTIGDAAVGGGVNKHVDPNTVGDRLSVGTAWLYSLFATGQLSVPEDSHGKGGFSYSSQKASDLNLQRAIWALEDETADSAGFTSAFKTLLINQFGSIANAQVNATDGEYGVYVLNLTSNGGRTQNQSQLYYNNVPESGATIAFLGFALVGLLGLRRKFAK